MKKAIIIVVALLSVLTACNENNKPKSVIRDGVSTISNDRH